MACGRSRNTAKRRGYERIHEKPLCLAQSGFFLVVKKRSPGGPQGCNPSRQHDQLPLKTIKVDELSELTEYTSVGHDLIVSESGRSNDDRTEKPYQGV